MRHAREDDHDDEPDEPPRSNTDELARLSEAVSIAPITLFTHDRDLRYTWVVNPVLGLTVQEIVGHTDAELLPPEAAAIVTSIKQRVLDSGTAERQLVRFDSQPTAVCYDVTVQPLYDGEGLVCGLTCATMDVTRQCAAEAALASHIAALRRQAKLIDSAHDAIIVRQLDGVILSWNVGAERTYGYANAKATGRVARDLLATRFPIPLSSIEATLLSTGSWEGELRHRHQDGSERVVHSRWVVEPVADGAPLVLEINRDVTAAVTAAAERRQTESRLSLALDTARMFVWEWKPQSDELYWSPEYTRILGPVPFDGTHKSFRATLHPDDAPRILETARRAFANGGRVTSTYRVRRHDGRMISLESCAELRTDANGQTSVVGVARDVTDRHEANAAMQDLSARLLTSQDEERRRVARELHDNSAQQLAAIQMNLSAIRARVRSATPELRQLVDDTAALADSCFNEIRTLSHLLHPPVLEELGLAGAVRDYADGFAARSGIRVDLEIDASLARLAQHVELALFRVLQESLANVHRHSGSRTASIRLTTAPTGVVLEIEDSGRGLPRREMMSAPLGVGIAGMAERLAHIGGRLDLGPGRAGGTLVTAFVPRIERHTT
jgi:PAS domain S-box-containing protein